VIIIKTNSNGKEAKYAGVNLNKFRVFLKVVAFGKFLVRNSLACN